MLSSVIAELVKSLKDVLITLNTAHEIYKILDDTVKRMCHDRNRIKVTDEIIIRPRFRPAIRLVFKTYGWDGVKDVCPKTYTLRNKLYGRVVAISNAEEYLRCMCRLEAIANNIDRFIEVISNECG